MTFINPKRKGLSLSGWVKAKTRRPAGYFLRSDRFDPKLFIQFKRYQTFDDTVIQILQNEAKIALSYF